MRICLYRALKSASLSIVVCRQVARGDLDAALPEIPRPLVAACCSSSVSRPSIRLAALTADPAIRDSSVSGYCVIASSVESIDPWFTMSLAEGQRVHLIVELIDERPVDRAAAIANLRAATTEMQCRSSGQLPTRDELHER